MTMVPRAQLIPLCDTGEPHAELYIHGFEAARTERDLAHLTATLTAQAPPGRCWLLQWGGWLGAKGSALRRLVETAAAEIHNRPLTPSSAEELRRAVPAILQRGLRAVASETLQFWSHAAEAERVGRRLRDMLDGHLEGVESLTVQGHSLGARLLHAALATADWSQTPLTDVWLLGGAVTAASRRWEAAVRHIRGRLINCYCPGDWVLRIAPLGEPLAGLRPLPPVHNRLENRLCSVGHDEYWQLVARR